MRQILICLFALLLLAAVACGDKKKKAEESAEEPACESNSDCESGMICLAGECASMKGTDIYTNTGSAVTPDKVKRHLDQVQKNAQKRMDNALDEALGQ